ncbi:ECF RNA polymerase sigma factor SigE [Aquisphaera giovannonii]|uniref:ECF RNA polymerase sigma factor SigE n=1 Tax=Aquisphaera giovannonii TaxID=406548 RepID=A0A5B9W5T2_9BACT|nr:sigma-70 family RNA polymerase sigma factor [Aquisphaera giovannonii]QEH35475.1 ECF RNA polymerase sigma factor SigE [Aquisphaera giovannonii]
MPPPPATRESLLLRLADPADRAAWVEFVDVYGPLVLATVRRRGFGHADAEDVTQRVFARVFRGLRTFEYAPRRGRFRDWLGTIVYREVLREYRARGRDRASTMPPEELDALADAGQDPEWADAFQSHLYQVAMGRCRARFEPRTWAAFEQVWVAGRPPAEVAAELGVSVDSVYVAKSRVLGALAGTIRELSKDLPSFSDGR